MRAATAYRREEIAARLAGTLECLRCDRDLPCPPEQAAEYAATGWPRCCGETMHLHPHPPIGAGPATGAA